MQEQLPQVRYLCYALEQGERAETPHLQGYVAFKQSITLSAIKAGFGGRWRRAHLEVARGTAAQNKAYCSKQVTDTNPLFEWGDIPTGNGEGGRSDPLDAMCLELQLGHSMVSVASENPATWVRNYSGLRAFRQLVVPQRDFWSKIYWCWGPSGSGKSRWAHSLAPRAETYVKEPDPWWDGYDPLQHKVVIMDDFRPWQPLTTCFTRLLRELDRYACTVQYKGGSTQLLAETIVITTPLPIEATFKDCDEVLEQIHRRIRESGGRVIQFPAAPGAVPELGELGRVALVAHVPAAAAAPPPPPPRPPSVVVGSGAPGPGFTRSSAPSSGPALAHKFWKCPACGSSASASSSSDLCSDCAQSLRSSGPSSSGSVTEPLSGSVTPANSRSPSGGRSTEATLARALAEQAARRVEARHNLERELRVQHLRQAIERRRAHIANLPAGDDPRHVAQLQAEVVQLQRELGELAPPAQTVADSDAELILSSDSEEERESVLAARARRRRTREIWRAAGAFVDLEAGERSPPRKKGRRE